MQFTLSYVNARKAVDPKLCVEIAMPSEHSRADRHWKRREATEIVVAVTLDRNIAKRGLDRQILQQRNGPNVAKVFAAHLEAAHPTDSVAMIDQTTIRNTLHHAFAILMAGSSVAQFEGTLKVTDCGI
jgi:hypothetical protein